MGIFPFYSGKASRLQQANQGRCIAYMFVMHVAEELPTWPEGDKRTRRWVRPCTCCCLAKCSLPKELSSGLL